MVGIAAAAVLSQSGVGWAHYVYQGGTIAEWGDNCANVRSETSHGSAGYGYSKGDNESKRKNFYTNFACQDPWNRGSGQMRVAISIFKYSNGQWVLCAKDSTWKTNSSSTAKLVREHNWPSNSHCGYGSYYTLTEGDILDDSVWHGGDRMSGNHVLPS